MMLTPKTAASIH